MSPGGDYSWAGGRNMALEDLADNTFVWGVSGTKESISASNAFLIFPAGMGGVGFKWRADEFKDMNFSDGGLEPNQSRR